VIKGVIHHPTTNTIEPMIKYAFRYNPINALQIEISFSARGLYKLKIIAGPNPNSVSERTVKILEKSPLSPRYSASKYNIKIFLEINPMRIINICPRIAVIIFRIDLEVLDIFFSLT
jgi:hypothetical protein